MNPAIPSKINPAIGSTHAYAYTFSRLIFVEGEYEGIGHCALGYVDGEYPAAPARKENRVFYVK